MAEGIVIGNLTIPVIKGDKGDKGNAGEIASISLVLLSPSSTAYAINNGSTTQAQIELGIPKGLSVSTTNINASGELVFTFNDNSTVNVGKVVGKGISEVTVTDDFDFVVTYTDGTSVTACNLEEEISGAINDILESYYTKTEIDNKGFITKEVNNLTNYTLKTNTGSSIELSINNSTYVMTLNLKNSAGTTISTGTIDLPLETMVVGATYDNTNKKIVLSLKNGSTIDVPVADLVSGLQSEINSNNKLSSDLVDDTSHTNKFVTASEKEQITTNATDISNIKDGTSIDSFGDVETALSGKEDSSNKTGVLNSSSTTAQYPNAKAVYDELVERDEEINQLYNDHPDITDTGTDLTLQGTGDLKMKVDVGGNSTQETTSTSEGDEYDSPSPEHKQDINNVEGNVEVKGSSKNLFDSDELLVNSVYNDNFITNEKSNFYGILEISKLTFPLTISTDIILNDKNYNDTSLRLNILDDSMNYITRIYGSNSTTSNSKSVIILTENKIPANAVYIKLNIRLNSAGYTENSQIEEGTTATPYVPHAENTVTFPLSQGQKLMLGDTLEDDGIHHKRNQIVLDGTENWQYDAGISACTLPGSSYNYKKGGNALCSHYKYDSNLNDNNTFSIGSGYFLMVKNGLSPNNFKSYLAQQYANNTPVIVEYELETETTEAYTSAQQTAYNKLKEMQSYYDLTYVVGSSDNAQPILTAHAKKSIKQLSGGDLSNYQTKITSTNKLNSDLVNDTNQTNKFVTSTEKNTWNSKQNATDNNLQTTNKTITSAINEVNSIAKGANQAISYTSYSAMVTAINALASTALNVGQNIYIETLEVPDLWVYKVESTSSSYTYTTDEAITTALETTGYIQVGYYKLSALETQKVDLTNYVENTDYANATTGGVVKISILTQSEYDELQTIDTNTFYMIKEERLLL